MLKIIFYSSNAERLDNAKTRSENAITEEVVTERARDYIIPCKLWAMPDVHVIHVCMSFMRACNSCVHAIHACM